MLFFIFYFSESLPGDDVPCRLLSCLLPSGCFPLPVSFFSDRVPRLLLVGYVYLVSTTGSAEDQFMWDNNNICDFVLFWLFVVFI